ncbi:MAG: hypothetical protein KFH87_09980, partial [Bacteroidetes bacterium]|nr:hypothetical protein [Bacteroidota bacterium]
MRGQEYIVGTSQSAGAGFVAGCGEYFSAGSVRDLQAMAVQAISVGSSGVRMRGKSATINRGGPMHTFIPRLLTVLLLCCASCSDPVDPGEPEPPPVHVQQDTTGHDIDWTVYTFGPGIPSSSLEDIIAFSDTNVWFVGKVYSDTPDSTSRYGDPDNLLRWNGREWRKDRIMVDQCRGFGYTMFGRLWSIAGPPHDIWMSTRGGAGARSDGVNFTPSCFKADSTSRYGALSWDIVYISDNRVYFAGGVADYSEITLYSNGGFRRIAYLPGVTPIHSLAADHWGNVWAAGYSGTTGEGCFLWRTPDGV